MSTEEIVTIILSLGTLLPLAISVVQQPRWSKELRTFLSVALSGFAGLVAYVAANGLSVGSASEVVIFVVGTILSSATAYKTIWKPSSIAGKIEDSTSPGSLPQDGERVDEEQ